MQRISFIQGILEKVSSYIIKCSEDTWNLYDTLKKPISLINAEGDVQSFITRNSIFTTPAQIKKAYPANLKDSKMNKKIPQTHQHMRKESQIEVQKKQEMENKYNAMIGELKSFRQRVLISSANIGFLPKVSEIDTFLNTELKHIEDKAYTDWIYLLLSLLVKQEEKNEKYAAVVEKLKKIIDDSLKPSNDIKVLLGEISISKENFNLKGILLCIIRQIKSYSGAKPDEAQLISKNFLALVWSIILWRTHEKSKFVEEDFSKHSSELFQVIEMKGYMAEINLYKNPKFLEYTEKIIDESSITMPSMLSWVLFTKATFLYVDETSPNLLSPDYAMILEVTKHINENIFDIKGPWILSFLVSYISSKYIKMDSIASNILIQNAAFKGVHLLLKSLYAQFPAQSDRKIYSNDFNYENGKLVAKYPIKIHKNITNSWIFKGVWDSTKQIIESFSRYHHSIYKLQIICMLAKCSYSI